MKTFSLSLLVLAIITFANEAKEDMPYPLWQEVGNAKLSLLWFDIYHAQLTNETGIYDETSAFKLTLTYLRSFEAKDLIDETFEQMNASEQQEKQWRPKLTKLWPNVTKLDQISFVKDAENNSHFFINQSYLGHISDPIFTEKFANIWLSDQSSYPKLSAKLKGKRK